MAEVLEGGGDMFNALAYGKPHPGTHQYLSTQFENATQHLNDAGQRFMAGARAIYEQVRDSTAARMARAVSRRVGHMWQSDVIRAMSAMGDLQQAPLTMQRWIMAEPTLRHRYQQQRVDGYSDTYVDMHPGDVGETHYDYRRVMQGMVQESEEAGWTATTWFEDLLPGDDELDIDEQVDIQTTWAAVVAHLRKGDEDPTSIYAAGLD